MPHSMQGSRGRVRFRGKNSPRFRRAAEQQERTMALLKLASDARAEAQRARVELARERRSMLTKVSEKARGFVSRLFGRKTG